MIEEMEATAKGWAEKPTKLASRRQRRDVLRNWVLGNGLLESVTDTHNLSEEAKEKVRDDIYAAAERGVSELRSVPVEKLTRKVAGSINGMIDSMRARGVAETTIFGHRWKIVSMFRWVELQVNEEKLVDFIKEVSAARITDNRQPEPLQIRTMLIKGSSKQKAFLSFLVCTGGRMGEAVQVKLSDIFWDEKPVRVEFPARKTKTAQIRYSYLSSECVQFLKDYIAERERAGRKSQWLFDGEEVRMTTAMGWNLIHDLFVKAGLIDEEEEEKSKVAGAGTGAHNAFHPHVLRDTNLGIAKLAGYPDSWAEFLAGHSTGSKENYIGKEKTGPLWLEKCEPAFCFLNDANTAESVKSLKQKVEDLEKGIETDRQIIEEQFLKPGMNAPRPKFESKKIDSTDEATLEQAIAEGFEPVPGLVANGHIFLRRKVA